MKKPRLGNFWSVVVTLGVVYAAVKWGIPAASREISSLPFPLPVPGTLMLIYMVLTVVALFMFVTFSDTYLEDFLRPVWKFLGGGFGKAPRALVLLAVPLLAAWQIHVVTAPRGVAAARGLWIDRPSCSAAARVGWAMGVAMVMGPTPPGTGVISEARSIARSKSTSPTIPLL